MMAKHIYDPGNQFGPDWTRLDQGVTNVCGGKIFLKQFPADTAQWGLSLPAIVCISIQLLASCSPTMCGNNLHQAGSNQEVTFLSLTVLTVLTPPPQPAQPPGFTEF